MVGGDLNETFIVFKDTTLGNRSGIIESEFSQFQLI